MHSNGSSSNSGAKKLSSQCSKSSSDLRQKTKVKQQKSASSTSSVFGSHRIKNEAPRPTIQWSDVKTGFKHFKIKRWNSIGSWVERETIKKISL